MSNFSEKDSKASKMVRVAIPTFRSRVSPVLDSCTRVLLVEVEHNREIERNEIYLDELSLTERMNILRKSHVTIVICGGISDMLQNMLQSAKIYLISGIAGEIDQVVDAYLSEKLDEPRFHMPGFKAEH
jgi:predicted Fe-Mo cluster-binding NifX family protein